MKLIGIIGKSGSGKTTLANMLQKDENITIIHLDKVTSANPIAKRIPKKFTSNYTNSMGEQGLTFSSNIMKLLYKIKENKILDKIYLKVLKIPRERTIEKQIKKYEAEGKKCVIIERIYISFPFVV